MIVDYKFVGYDLPSVNAKTIHYTENGENVGFAQFQFAGDTVVVLSFEYTGDSENYTEIIESAIRQCVKERETAHTVQAILWLDNANIWN